MFISGRTFPEALLSGHIQHSSGLRGIPHHGHTRVDQFSSLVRYLVLLRNNGTLDDQAFSHLVRHAAALFVEAEVENCVNQVLNEKTIGISF